MGNRWIDIERDLADGGRGPDCIALAPLVAYLAQQFPTLVPGCSHTTFVASKQHQFEGVEIYLFFYTLTPPPFVRFKIGICCGVGVGLPARKAKATREQPRWFQDEVQCDENNAYRIIDMYCKQLSRADEVIPVLIQYVKDR